MPTVLRVSGYRFFFFSDDHPPAHVHVEKGDSYARIEIHSLKVTASYRLSSRQLNKLVKIVGQQQALLTGIWNEYFS